MNNFKQYDEMSDDTIFKIARQNNINIKYIGFIEDLEKIPNGISIINLGDKHIGGSHWTVLYRAPRFVIYFDSFGVGPEDRVIDLTKGLSIYWSNVQLQGLTEGYCGVWALLYAKFINEKKDMLNKASKDERLKIIQSFVNSKSKFNILN